VKVLLRSAAGCVLLPFFLVGRPIGLAGSESAPKACPIIEAQSLADGSIVGPGEDSGVPLGLVGLMASPPISPEAVVVLDDVSLGKTQLLRGPDSKDAPSREGGQSEARFLSIKGVLVRRVCGLHLVETRAGKAWLPVFTYGGDVIVSDNEGTDRKRGATGFSTVGVECWAGSIHRIGGQSVFLADRNERPWCKVVKGRIYLVDTPRPDFNKKSLRYRPLASVRKKVLRSESLVSNPSESLSSMILQSDTWWSQSELYAK
jgi:hypothetical protein